MFFLMFALAVCSQWPVQRCGMSDDDILLESYYARLPRPRPPLPSPPSGSRHVKLPAVRLSVHSGMRVWNERSQRVETGAEMQLFTVSSS